MKQTTKTLASSGVFLLVAVALAFAAAWVGRDEEKKTEQKEKTAKLFELDKAKVREVRLSKAGALVAAFKRDAAAAPWKITEPVQTEADDAAVAAIVDKLESIKQKSELEGLDLKTVGLADEAKARLSISITEEGGKPQTLLVGEDNPFDQSVYVKKPGDAVVRVVAGTEKAPFEKELFDLRDKRVAHLDEAAEIRKVEVTPEVVAARPAKGAKAPAAAAGALAYALERDGGSWKLLSPAPGPADGATVDKLVAAVKGLRATRVAEEKADEAALRSYGLAAPKFTVTLTAAPPGGKETFQRKLAIGQAPRGSEKTGAVTAKTYAKRDDSPAVFEVDAQVLKDLGKELFDLQDKVVAKFDREAVRRIDYAFGDGKPTISVSRKKDAPPDGGTADEQFEVLAPSKGPAKKWKLSGSLFSLGGMKASAFGEATPKDQKGLARFGLDKPSRTVTLYGDKVGDKETVLARFLFGAETGPKDKPRRFLLLEGGARVVEVDKPLYDELPQKPDDVQEAPPPPPPPPAALSLPDAGLAP